MVEISYQYCRTNSKGRVVYRPLTLSLQERILPKNFGREEDGFKFDYEIFERFSRKNRGIKNKMVQLEKVVADVAMMYPIDVTPSPEELKKVLLEKLGRNRQVDTSFRAISDFLKEEVTRYTNETGKQTQGSLDENTIKTYRTVLTLIREYECATAEVLTFKNFDINKYWKLWNVLDDILRGKITLSEKIRDKAQPKQKYGYSVNSIRKYQDALLKTLNEAEKKYGLTVPFDTKASGIKLKKADSKRSYYLSEEEIQLVIDSDVSHDKKLQLAKDYLITSCCTGLRYQSMVHASKQKIETANEGGLEFHYFESEQKKTKTRIFMPVLKPVQEVLERNNGKFPNWGANGTMNKSLKLLGEVVGLDEPTTETIFPFRGDPVKIEKPKHKLISTHDGRKSFRSNLAKKKADNTIVSDMTHPDRIPEKAMDKYYIKTTMMDKAVLFVKEIRGIDSGIYKI